MLRFITLQREPPSSVVSFGMGSGQAWEVQWFLSLTCCTIVQDMSQDWISRDEPIVLKEEKIYELYLGFLRFEWFEK